MPIHTRHHEHDPFAPHPAVNPGHLEPAAPVAAPAALRSAAPVAAAASDQAAGARLFHQWTDGLADSHHPDASGLHAHAKHGFPARTAGEKHDVAALEKAFEHAEGATSTHGGRLTGGEMKDILHVANQGGVSTTERQFIDFRMGEVQNVHGSAGAESAADSAYNSFRTHGFHHNYEGYDSRLPNPRQRGNRLGGDDTKFNVKLETTTPDGKKEHTKMVDGLGNPIGDLLSSKVSLNYGQKKEINGTEYVYAFHPNVHVDAEHHYRGASDKIQTSGWIPADAVQNHKQTGPSSDVRDMADVHAPKVHTSSTAMEITGGTDAQIDHARKEKVVAKPRKGEGNMSPGDYLKRDSNTVNFLYNLPDGHGGVGADAVTAGDPNVQFFPSNIKHAIKTYENGKPTKDPFTFVYGRIHDKVDGADTSEDRYGWIAQEALHKVPTAKKAAAAPDITSTPAKDALAPKHAGHS